MTNFPLQQVLALLQYSAGARGASAWSAGALRAGYAKTLQTPFELFVEYATISVFSAFETNPWPLILIDMGRPLIAWSISGLVLGAWQRKPATS